MATHIPYIPPYFHASAFNCPFCNAYSHQGWGFPPIMINNTTYGGNTKIAFCRCSHCHECSIWVDMIMVFPPAVISPPPNADIPEEIKIDFEEARVISVHSPRGAAALLRLCIQKLCKHLGEDGKNINDDIAALVRKGLPEKVQKALDVVRVVGNDAVHPGQIDLKDNPDVAHRLFGLVNIIAEVMISQPKHVDDIYEKLVPEQQKKAIEKRDTVKK